MNRSYAEFVRRKKNQFGLRFDESDLDTRFVRYFESGDRIKVSEYGRCHFGTVGVSCGIRPVFLLMATSRSVGSSFTLGKDTIIVAVKRGGNYCPVWR